MLICIKFNFCPKLKFNFYEFVLTLTALLKTHALLEQRFKKQNLQYHGFFFSSHWTELITMTNKVVSMKSRAIQDHGKKETRTIVDDQSFCRSATM